MMALRVPEMAIDEAEAKTLAEAIARVEKYYPRVREIVTGRIAAHGVLVLAICQVYGTRFAAIAVRVKKEKAEASHGPTQPNLYTVPTPGPRPFVAN